MNRTAYGIELNKSESEELMKTGYVLSEDNSICVVDQDGEYLVFERKQFTQLSIYDYLEE
jgi:hypothetical protein